MDLAQGVRAAVARGRQSGSYLGTVTAIDTTALALTVDIGTGTPLTGVRWVGSYAPVVGDFVTVLRAGTSWVVLGKLSKDLTGQGRRHTTISVMPVAVWTATALWYMESETSTWSWSVGGMSQGRTGGRPPYTQVWGGLAVYPQLATLIPSGATVKSARLTFTRDWDDDIPTPRSPRIYGHATTLVTGTSPPASYWVPGYGAWSPGGLLQGETASWALPSSWLTALLAGTLRGIGITSQAPVDALRLTPAAPLTISYSEPA